MIEPLSLREIRVASGQAAATITHRLRVWQIDAALGAPTRTLLKLELFQLTGRFKARAALLNALALSLGALALPLGQNP